MCVAMNQPRYNTSKKRVATSAACGIDHEQRQPCSCLKTTPDDSPRSRSLSELELTQPESQQEPAAAVEPDGAQCSPIFTCNSALSSKSSTRHTKTAQLRFSNTIRVRAISPSGDPPADSDGKLKEHDGPNPTSCMLDACLHAFFEHRGNRSLEALQFVLGRETCSEIGEHPVELCSRFWELAARLDNLEAGERIGVLPSCTQVSMQHARGIKHLALWLRSNDISDYPGDEQIKRLAARLDSSDISS